MTPPDQSGDEEEHGDDNDDSFYHRSQSGTNLKELDSLIDNDSPQLRHSNSVVDVGFD